MRATCPRCFGFGYIKVEQTVYATRWVCGACGETGVVPTTTTWEDGVIARSVKRVTK